MPLNLKGYTKGDLIKGTDCKDVLNAIIKYSEELEKRIEGLEHTCDESCYKCLSNKS